MIAQIYRYKIKKNSLKEWQNINNKARLVYKKFGGGKTERFMKEDEKMITIMEINYYPSLKKYESVMEKARKDAKRNALLKQFVKIVDPNSIISEQYTIV